MSRTPLPCANRTHSGRPPGQGSSSTTRSSRRSRTRKFPGFRSARDTRTGSWRIFPTRRAATGTSKSRARATSAARRACARPCCHFAPATIYARTAPDAGRSRGLRERCAMQDESNREVARLIAELEQAEAFEQKLRQYIIDAKDQLAAGNTSVALSLLNDAISYIESAPDVVTGSEHRP